MTNEPPGEGPIERFQESWWLQGLIAIAGALPSPTIVNPIALATSAVGAHMMGMQRKRAEQFAQQIHAAVEATNTRLDEEFLRREEFLDFALSALERAVRTSNPEKLEALRNAFIHGSSPDGSSGPFKDIVLRLVGDLTAEHMRLLRVATDRQARFTDQDREANADYTGLEHFAETLPDLADLDRAALTLDLVNIGLLGNWWIGRYNGGAKVDRVFVTDLGLRFVQFITLPNRDL